MTALVACSATWPAPPRALHKAAAQPHQQRLSERAAVSRRHALASNPSRAAAAATAALRRQWRRPGAPAAAAEQQEASSETSGVITTERLANLRYYTPDGLWVVRPLDKGNMAEVRRVVKIQTDAFHTPAALPVLDGLAKSFFEAEVLSEMSKKLRFNPQELFISLVIESTVEHNNGSNSSSDSEASSNETSSSKVSSSTTNGSSSSSSNGKGSSFRAGSSSSSNGSSTSTSSAPGVLGVVEISYMAAKDTLARLEPGTEGFCYVASMVVAPGWRRRGAAQALLRAAELAAEAFEERQTVLHVYQDNEAAVQLYRRAGYEVLHAQPRTWAVLGNRPRYLMRKQW